MNATALRRRAVLSAALATVGLAMHAQATSLFWDTNGSAAGAGNPATGTWDTTVQNWNTDSTGADQGVISAYPVDGSTTDVVFSAGSDALLGHTVTINGQVSANSINSNFGTQTFAGANFVTGQPPTDTLTLGAGGWTVTKGSVQNGAPTVGASVKLIIGANQTWTMNGIPSFFTLNAPVQFDNTLTLARLATAGSSNANYAFKNDQGTGIGGVTVGAANSTTLQMGVNPVFDTGGTFISGPVGTGVITLDGGRISTTAAVAGVLPTITVANPLKILNGAAIGGQSNTGSLTFVGGATFTSASSGKTVLFDSGANAATQTQIVIFNSNVTLQGNPVLNTNTNDKTTFNSPISDDFATTGVGKGFTKTGNGIMTLTGTNTFHGGVTINQGSSSTGTLLLQSADLTNNIANASTITVNATGANLDVTGIVNGFAVASGQTLTGVGKVWGNVTVGSGASIAGGTGGLNLQNNLTLAGGGTISFDTNKPLNVTGNLGLTDGGTTSVVLPNLAALGAGTSTVISYAGSLSGTGTFAVSAPPNTRANPSIDATSTPNQVNLVINGSAANLVWTGDGAGNQWNVFNTPNWNNGGTQDKFYNLDKVTFDDTSTNTTVNVVDTVLPGSVTISGSQSFTFQGSGGISGTGSLVVNTSGTVTMSTSNSYTGGTNVQAGTLLITNADALPSGSISFSGGASLVLAPSLNHAVKAFPLATGGLLDLNNNKLIDDYVSNDPLSTVTSAVQSAYNGGAWTGTSGITSTAAAAIAADANNPHKTGIGFAEASALPGVTTFGGLPTDSTMLLMRYTYLGDANLDGVVNALDFNQLATNFGTGKTWVNGDFNYDGSVDTNDFTLLASNFGFSLASAPSLGTVVPEPAMLSLIAMSGVAVLSRRRRSR